MKRIMKRTMALVLAALLLTGCGVIPDESVTPNQSLSTTNVSAEPTFAEVPVRTGPRPVVEWAKDAVVYEVNIRQYTPEGTFAAFTEHLPELKEMGITTLWLMPIHPISETNRKGSLGSYYSITDYRAVNPEFGDANDFKVLVDVAHSLEMTVMLDWVANHTGWDCPWITEHPDWYTQKDGKIIHPAGTDWDDVADLNFDNMYMRAEMISCMRYWVEKFDIDGFRCDHASGVPTDFWEAARAELETIKPLLMLAEDNTVPELLNYAFDMNYNWGLYDFMLGVAAGSMDVMMMQYKLGSDLPEGAWSLNFLDNHDKNSWERTIVGAFGKDALPSMWTMLYTIPGTPLVYTGDEIGLDHNIAFMERDPINWKSTNLNYRPLLKELAAIRSENPALHAGDFGGAMEYLSAGKDILAFRRQVDGNTILCLINMNASPSVMDVSDLVEGTDTVLLRGSGANNLRTEDTTAANAKLTGTITMQPWEFWIVRKG